MSDGSVHLGALRVELHLPSANSLKAKRAILNRAKAALRNDLQVSVAEVGEQDTWQRAVLGVGVVADHPEGVDRVLPRVIAVLERDPAVVVSGATQLVDVLDADTSDPTATLMALHGWHGGGAR